MMGVLGRVMNQSYSVLLWLNIIHLVCECMYDEASRAVVGCRATALFGLGLNRPRSPSLSLSKVLRVE